MRGAHFIIRSTLISLALLVLTVVPSAASELTWHTSAKAAMADAAKGDRYVLVDLYAEWCGWCKVLEREVFTSAPFRAFAADKVLLRVDVEDGGEGSAMQARHGVSSLPTMLILDANGALVGKLPGYAKTDTYIYGLRTEIERYESSLEDFERVRVGDDIAAAHVLAETLHRRGDGARALVLYEKIARTLPSASPEMARLQLRIADAQRVGGDYAAAQKSASRAHNLAQTLADRTLVEQVELLRAHIAQDAGDCDQAVASLETFLREHPKSPHRREASQALTYLRRTPDVCS